VTRAGDVLRDAEELERLGVVVRRALELDERLRLVGQRETGRRGALLQRVGGRLSPRADGLAVVLQRDVDLREVGLLVRGGLPEVLDEVDRLAEPLEDQERLAEALDALGGRVDVRVGVPQRRRQARVARGEDDLERLVLAAGEETPAALRGADVARVPRRAARCCASSSIVAGSNSFVRWRPAIANGTSLPAFTSCAT
jgi:hypothetical protein